jgi:hypothetical protein
MVAGPREIVPWTKLLASYCSMKVCASSKPWRKMEDFRDSVACALLLLYLIIRDNGIGEEVPDVG